MLGECRGRVGLDDAGTPFAFAENRILFQDGANQIIREFASAWFSADGTYLFVSTQDPRITHAITGPWGGPPPSVVPEVGRAVLLPLGAAALLGGAVAFRNRTRRPAPMPSA